MASLVPRHNKDGSTSYRILLRYKETPLVSLTFISLEDAEAWLKENEARHALGNPFTVREIKAIRAKLNRENRFNRQ
jgi:hypothetical protein